MERPAGGAGPESLRRMLEQLMSRHREEVRLWDPCFGIVAPPLEPRVLTESSDASVTLAHGDLVGLDGPLVTVETRRPTLGLPAASLSEHLTEEHARLLDWTGLSAGAPMGVDGTGRLRLAGLLLPCVVRRAGTLWAARVAAPTHEHAPPVVVTVVARGVPEGEVHLERVQDLSVYWHGRSEHLAPLSLQRLGTPATDAGPPLGLASHKALIELTVGRTGTGTQRGGGGARASSLGTGKSGEYQRRWQAAVHAQMNLTGEARPQAEERVGTLLNHLTSLDQRAEWFMRPVVREAAIHETLIFNALDQNVASRAAQVAWRRLWDERRAGRLELLDFEADGGSADEAQGVIARHTRLDREWREAWNRWLRSQGPLNE